MATVYNICECLREQNLKKWEPGVAVRSQEQVHSVMSLF